MTEIVKALADIPTANAMAGIFGFAVMVASFMMQVAIVIDDVRKAIADDLGVDKEGGDNRTDHP